MPTIPERIAETQAKAMRLYLQRQQVEQQRQSLQSQAAAIEQAMLRTDGELELLEKLNTAEKVPDGV